MWIFWATELIPQKKNILSQMKLFKWNTRKFCFSSNCYYFRCEEFFSWANKTMWFNCSYFKWMENNLKQMKLFQVNHTNIIYEQKSCWIFSYIWYQVICSLRTLLKVKYVYLYSSYIYMVLFLQNIL